MRVSELRKLLDDACASTGKFVSLFVSAPSAGPGIPGASWNITELFLGVGTAPILYADIEYDPWDAAFTAHALGYKRIDQDSEVTIQIIFPDGDSGIFDIVDAYVDADGPTEYGMDDDSTAVILTISI